MLKATISDSKCLCDMLKIIKVTNDITLSINEHGIKFTSQIAKSFQVNSFFCSENFDSYEFIGEVVYFDASVNAMIECITICMNMKSTMVNISTILLFDATKHLFVIELSENCEISCRFEIVVRKPSEMVPLEFNHSEKLNKLILKSETTRDILNDIDSSSELITFKMDPTFNYFRVSTIGTNGESHIDIYFESELMILSEIVFPLIISYKTRFIKMALNAMKKSDKFSVRIATSSNVISIQHILTTKNNQNSFVEFLCLPQIIDE